jgi:hypothetical protein
MKRFLKYTGFGLFVGIAIIFIAPDFRYQAKAWLRNLLREDSGWEHSVSPLKNGEYSLMLSSPAFVVDTLYPSMTGPSDIHHFSLIGNAPPELVFITGYATNVEEVSTAHPASSDYLCHNNLDYALADYCDYWQLKDRTKTIIPRLGTITQGQEQISFPAGFGLPMMSDHDLSTSTQVLNANNADADFEVRHNVLINYVQADESLLDYKPLFQQSINVLVMVDTAAQPDNITSEIEDCSPALPTIAFLSTRKNGDLYTGHWVIPEGKDTFSTDVTNRLNIPFSTTLHYAGVHVHPYCTALELIDKTTNETVFRSTIDNVPNTTKMSHIDAYSSIKGTMIYQDHTYELVCYTNNDSGKEQDMMAVMLLYLYDKELHGKLNDR